MKIMLAGAFPPQEKGEAGYLGSYACALRELGEHSITIVSQYESAPVVETWNGFSVHRCIRDRTARPSFAPQRELVEAVRAHTPDVLHLHYGPNQDYGGRIGEPLVGALQQIRALGVKTVVSLHSTWLPADVVNSAPVRKIPAALRPLAAQYFSRVMRALWRACDELLCVVAGENSPMAAEFVKAYDLTIGEELFGCATDAAAMPPPDGDPLVLAFGFLRPEKGFEFLLEAFSHYVAGGGRGRVLIAGKPLNDEDRRYASMLAAATAQVRNAEFRLGFLPEKELHAVLASASVLVLPYLRAVGPSAPMHLAMGMGRPVIATAVGHNRAAADAVTLVPPHSSEALTDALRRLLEGSSAWAEAAERSLDGARRRAWKTLAVRQSARYAELISNKRGRSIA